MPVQKLKEFLHENKVKYVTIMHSPYYTAQEIAATSHISGKELAKTVMVKMDNQLAMVVLPASYKLDLEAFGKALGVDDLELASEEEFKYRFPGCEVGAMPPFGNLFDMPVFVAAKLAEDEEIAFNAGSHTELIRLAYKDYERLVHPRMIKGIAH
jgi:Ala-tRNA(Pro) deacylase